MDDPLPVTEHAHFVLDWDGPAGRVLCCADLLMRDADGPFRFVPDEHQDAICPAHGAPALTRGSRALEQALA